MSVGDSHSDFTDERTDEESKPLEEARSVRNKSTVFEILAGLLFVIASILIAAYLHSYSPRITDPDSLYHFRHAQLYSADGLFMTAFPWTTFSVVSVYNGDIWYGFHMLLAPVAHFWNSLQGVKIGGVIVLTAFLLLFAWAAKRMKVAMPYLGPFAVLLGSPMLTLRWLSVRPQALSVPLCALLVSFICTGGAVQAGLCSFAIAWLHESFSIIVFLFAGTSLIMRRWNEGTWAWREAVAVSIGLVVGWLLRPNPLGAARIAFVQVFDLEQAKRGNIPLSFAPEIYPVTLSRFFWLSGGLFVAWLAAMLAFLLLWRRASPLMTGTSRSIVWSCLALSIICFGMCINTSARGIEPWALCGMLFTLSVVAMIWRVAEALWKDSEKEIHQGTVFGTVLILGIVSLSSIVETGPALQAGVTDANRLKTAMQWLQANSRNDSIVFSPRWDTFPEMFFWNQKNRYINGMDPIFMYAYSPDDYWLAHHLAMSNATAYTSTSPPSAPNRVQVDTFAALKSTFHASYLLLTKEQFSALINYAESDRRFRKVFESEAVVVFDLESSRS